MQNVIVIGLALLSAAYLLWLVVGPFLGSTEKSAGCHGCSAACELKDIKKPAGEVRPVMWVANRRQAEAFTLSSATPSPGRRPFEP